MALSELYIVTHTHTQIGRQREDTDIDRSPWIDGQWEEVEDSSITERMVCFADSCDWQNNTLLLTDTMVICVTDRMALFADRQNGALVTDKMVLCDQYYMYNYIFDFFKTVSRILFKLDGDVPWLGLYPVCSKWSRSRSIDLIYFMNSFVHFWRKSLQIFFSKTAWTNASKSHRKWS